MRKDPRQAWEIDQGGRTPTTIGPQSDGIEPGTAATAATAATNNTATNAGRTRGKRSVARSIRKGSTSKSTLIQLSWETHTKSISDQGRHRIGGGPSRQRAWKGPNASGQTARDKRINPHRIRTYVGRTQSIPGAFRTIWSREGAIAPAVAHESTTKSSANRTGHDEIGSGCKEIDRGEVRFCFVLDGCFVFFWFFSLSVFVFQILLWCSLTHSHTYILIYDN